MNFPTVAAALIGLMTVSAGAAEPKPFRFRLTADPITLDWNQAHTSLETHILMNLMEGLAEAPSSATSDLPTPALASRWSASADGKTLTLTLLEGVKWSDDKPLRAQHFIDSWTRLLSPNLHASYASLFDDVEGAKDFHSGKLKDAAKLGFRAKSDLELEIKLVRPSPTFLHLLTFWATFPIRRDILNKLPADWGSNPDLIKKVPTLGPFLLEAWVPGKSIRMRRNPNYYRMAQVGAAVPRTVEALIVPKDQEARTLFEAGKLDVRFNLSTEDYLKFNGSDTLVQYPYWATYYVGINPNVTALRDVRVRRAFALALQASRAEIPQVLKAGQTPARGFLPPGIASADGEVTAENETTAQARKLLAEAGYVDGKGFPTLEFWLEKLDGAKALGEFYVAKLKQTLGVTVTIRIEDPRTFQRTLAARSAPLYLNHWGADFPDAANFFEIFKTGAGPNYLGWSNAEYDGLIAKGASSLDAGVRAAAYRDAEKLLRQTDAVMVPLFYRKQSALLGKRVKSLAISPLNYFYLKTIEMKPETADAGKL